MQTRQSRFALQRFRSKTVASLALLGFALSACSDLATQPERRAAVGTAALERGTVPGGSRPDGAVGTMGDGSVCAELPGGGGTICGNTPGPQEECTDNPFGAECDWTEGGGTEPPYNPDPGSGGGTPPGGGDPGAPPGNQEECAEGEECEEEDGPALFLLCLVSHGASNVGTYTGMYLDYQDAKRTYEQAMRSYNYATLAYLQGEITLEEHEAKKKTYDQARDDLHRIVTQANRTATDAGGAALMCVLGFFIGP